MPKVIVIGDSSGIGKALALLLAREGCEVGLAARRLEFLLEMQKKIQSPTYVKRIDITKTFA